MTVRMQNDAQSLRVVNHIAERDVKLDKELGDIPNAS